MICLTLSGKTIEENKGIVEKNRDLLDSAELRVDLLERVDKEEISSFLSTLEIPVILTLRRVSDGGKCALGENERDDILSSLLDLNFTYVDLESDFKGRAEEKAKERGIKIIKSCHDFSGIAEDAEEFIRENIGNGYIPKLASFAHSTAETLRLFKMKEIEGDKIIVGMGEFGVPVRILYKKAGSLLTFASDEEEVAPGQVSLSLMKTLYRADRVDEETEIFGITGNPVLHSLSPLIHNDAFKKLSLNAIYVPFPTSDIKSFISLSSYLKLKGFSVTMPFKSEIIPLLSNISPHARDIESVNTVIKENGVYAGYNTDADGFLSPIKKEIEEKRIKSAIVLGAGGAASAVIYALKKEGVGVTVLNRTIERAREKASFFKAGYDSLENMGKYSGKVDLVVQATSLGLKGGEINFPFAGTEIAYELNYSPRYTEFLKSAEKKGCRIVFGYDMLLGQAKLQFEKFTSFSFPDL